MVRFNLGKSLFWKIFVCPLLSVAIIAPYFLDRNLEDFVSVIRLADLPNYGPNYGEEEENYGEEKEGREA